MKPFKIVFFSLIITSFSASAQMGNSMNSMNNRMLNQNNQVPQSNPPTPSAADIEKSRNERIEEFMVKMKAALTLDDLQYIAIKNDILATSKRMDIVMKSSNSEEDKAEEVRAMQEKTEKNINSYLNTDQKEKYRLFLEEKNTKKKEKDKKKKKAEENNTAVTN
ncbi:hypothetical protein ACSVH2_05760 [Flavobacterium sp. RSB2_4_14]|uniref:hypothetical protein n=1 Tax=Flavobacterium sp. RSB2_4_14 TaxID=3447665 RepID=UPI003F325A4C